MKERDDIGYCEKSYDPKNKTYTCKDMYDNVVLTESISDHDNPLILYALYQCILGYGVGVVDVCDNILTSNTSDGNNPYDSFEFSSDYNQIPIVCPCCKEQSMVQKPIRDLEIFKFNGRWICPACGEKHDTKQKALACHLNGVMYFNVCNLCTYVDIINMRWCNIDQYANHNMFHRVLYPYNKLLKKEGRGIISFDDNVYVSRNDFLDDNPAIVSIALQFDLLYGMKNYEPYNGAVTEYAYKINQIILANISERSEVL